MKRQICLIFTMLIGVVLAMNVIVSGATSMEERAKAIANGSRYAIVTDTLAHKTKVYDTRDYKVVASSPSCGARDQFYGLTKMTGKKKFDVDGSVKDDKGSVYHEYYYSGMENGIAIHTILYKRGTENVLYHGEGIQDSEHPFDNNWSRGCTRANKELCKFVYENCEEGTPYMIY